MLKSSFNEHWNLIKDEGRERNFICVKKSKKLKDRICGGFNLQINWSLHKTFIGISMTNINIVAIDRSWPLHPMCINCLAKHSLRSTKKKSFLSGLLWSMPSLQWLIYSPDCHYACCGLDSAAILFLAPLWDKSPRHRRLSPLMLSAFFRESITWPRRSDFLAQLYTRSRSLMRVAVFRSGSCTNTRISGGKLFFISRIVATRLMRLYLHAPLSEMKRTGKTQFTVTYGVGCTRYVQFIASRFIVLSVQFVWI